MTKSLFTIFALFFFASCQNPNDCTQPLDKNLNQTSACASAPAPSASPTTSPSTHDPDPSGDHLEANITYTNFEVKDEDKVLKAIEIIKKVVSSQEFKDRVLNFSYNGKKGFVDTTLTNEEVFQKIMDGAETLLPEVDHEMDLELELYTASGSTVGYTYPDVLKIWMNRKFFDTYTPAEVSDNIFHEWTHKLGFEHAASYSESRDYSVPYGLGYLVEELGKKYE